MDVFCECIIGESSIYSIDYVEEGPSEQTISESNVEERNVEERALPDVAYWVSCYGHEYPGQCSFYGFLSSMFCTSLNLVEERKQGLAFGFRLVCSRHDL